MRFHPFTIKFYEKTKNENGAMMEVVDAARFEGEDDIVSLLTFQPSQPMLHIPFFRVGDVFYHKERRQYFIFSLQKESGGADEVGGIKGFGFYLLMPFETQVEYVYRYDINSYFSYESFCNTFIKPFLKKSDDFYEFIGNIYVHEKMDELFEAHLNHDQYPRPIEAMLENIENKTSDYYRHNWSVIALLDEKTGNYEALRVNEKTPRQIFRGLRSHGGRFEIFLTIEPVLEHIPWSHALVSRYNLDMKEERLTAKTGTLYTIREDVDYERYHTLFAEHAPSPATKQLWMDKLDYWQTFFLVLSEKGIMESMSLKEGMKSQTSFLFHPSAFIYQKIEPSNQNEAYLDKLLEIL